jgi:hypothetical protein
VEARQVRPEGLLRGGAGALVRDQRVDPAEHQRAQVAHARQRGVVEEGGQQLRPVVAEEGARHGEAVPGDGRLADVPRQLEEDHVDGQVELGLGVAGGALGHGRRGVAGASGPST